MPATGCSRSGGPRSRQRIVLEPDARNDAALRRLVSCGFKLGAEIDLPHKRAQLAFLPRWRFARLLGLRAGAPAR